MADTQSQTAAGIAKEASKMQKAASEALRAANTLHEAAKRLRLEIEEEEGKPPEKKPKKTVHWSIPT